MIWNIMKRNDERKYYTIMKLCNMEGNYWYYNDREYTIYDDAILLWNYHEWWLLLYDNEWSDIMILWYCRGLIWGVTILMKILCWWWYDIDYWLNWDDDNGVPWYDINGIKILREGSDKMVTTKYRVLMMPVKFVRAVTYGDVRVADNIAYVIMRSSSPTIYVNVLRAATLLK